MAEEPNETARSYTPYLEHVRAIWKAEEENARRLAARVNLQLTLIAAFLGLGLFRLVERPLDPDSLLSWFGHIALLLALGFLGLAALLLLNVIGGKAARQAEETQEEGRRLPASVKLYFGEEDLEGLGDPAPGGPGFGHARAFLRMSEGAYDLGVQNLIEIRRIDRAQQFIVIGFVLLLVAIGCYAFEGSKEADDLGPQQGAHVEEIEFGVPEGPTKSPGKGAARQEQESLPRSPDASQIPRRAPTED